MGQAFDKLNPEQQAAVDSQITKNFDDIANKPKGTWAVQHPSEFRENERESFAKDPESVNRLVENHTQQAVHIDTGESVSPLPSPSGAGVIRQR
jgi:hypothetical protein